MTNDFNCYAVAGNPITHSISPNIFNHLFEESGVTSYYTRILALSPEEVLDLVRELRIKGLNITAPFKEDLFKLVKNIDEHAKDLGAINVISTMAGMQFGSNTDIYGVMQTIEDYRIDLEGRDILVLGAGGAAKAVIKGMADRTKRITVLNRTVEKAKAIAEQFGIKYDSLDKYKEYICDVDIIVSTLPDGVNLDLSMVDHFAVFINANYHKPQDVSHANYVSGETWLMNQAMHTYNIFTWYQPDRHDFVRAMNAPRKIFSNIFLVGFSGSGKTTLGKALAEKMGMTFLDTDEEIEKHAGKSINKIFEEDGEYGFRNIELEVLKKMQVCENTVISTGGGAVEFEATRNVMKERGYVVYCYAPLEVCLERADTNNRPKLAASEQEIQDLYEHRKRMYYIASDLLVNTRNDFDKLIEALKNDFDRTISLKK